MHWRVDPGPCPICGADHVGCSPTGASKSIEMVQLPSRDAMAATVRDVAPAVMTQEASFSTGTYRGKRKP
jgi:hypothetical protein